VELSGRAVGRSGTVAGLASGKVDLLFRPVAAGRMGSLETPE
jgi:hypothetical protein